MKHILVTGGSGFVGRTLIPMLLETYPKVRITSLSLSEYPAHDQGFATIDTRFSAVLGDIRDYNLVVELSREADVVIHLAAMKRVDQGEEECEDTVSTNVGGTMNLLKAFVGATFIQMSTDKVIEPVNCYGATKMVAEKLLLERAKKCTSGARFMAIRSGNIIGSTGSVIDIWKHQIAEHNEITVTDPNMMRFYTTVQDVARLIIAVLERGENGKIYLTPDDHPLVLRDLIQKALRLYGNEQTKVRSIGLRPGERMAERMSLDNETGICVRCEDFLSTLNIFDDTKKINPFFD